MGDPLAARVNERTPQQIMPSIALAVGEALLASEHRLLAPTCWARTGWHEDCPSHLRAGPPTRRHMESYCPEGSWYNSPRVPHGLRSAAHQYMCQNSGLLPVHMDENIPMSSTCLRPVFDNAGHGIAPSDPSKRAET